VHQLCDEANRWTAVEDEPRTMRNGVSGTNLIRRQRIALITAQAYICSQIARDPPTLSSCRTCRRSRG